MGWNFQTNGRKVKESNVGFFTHFSSGIFFSELCLDCAQLDCSQSSDDSLSSIIIYILKHATMSNPLTKREKQKL